MDGRIQLPVNQYLCRRFGVRYVDTVTEPGPCAILAENSDDILVKSILGRVGISVEKHGSRGIAVVGHYDCAGNPVDMERQKEQILLCLELLKRHFKDVEVVGLYVDDHWKVCEV